MLDNKCLTQKKKADIRSRPEGNSLVIGQAAEGAVLKFKYKRGEWFRVDIVPDEEEIIRRGYIHQDSVEEIDREEKPLTVRVIKGGKKKEYTGEKITIKFKDADIRDVIIFLCEVGGLNVVFDPGVSGRITCYLRDVPWDQALDVILKANRLGKVVEGNVLRAGKTEHLIEDKK